MARKSKMHPIIRLLLTIIITVLCVVLIYLSYVFISYNRIDDNLPITPDVSGVPADNTVELGTEYKITSYNIGFGAYTADYSFFMDGGESSWASSENSVRTNITDIGNLLNGYNSDLYILQEVDTDGTRTYHVNEYEMIQNLITNRNYIFAQNFHSAFLMYPLTEPHGANNSGLVTISSFAVDNAIRRQLPISTSVTKIVDLDRCYSITRYPVENGKYLCVYNIHLSAYGSDASVREGQLGLLFGDMSADYEAGNYVICGGDFNHNLRVGADGNAPDWAQSFPRESLPAGFSMAFDTIDDADIVHDSCRNADEPYNPETTFTVMLDGFIVSDNVTVTGYRNFDYGYAYSDHDPVTMAFVLN